MKRCVFLLVFIFAFGAVADTAALRYYESAVAHYKNSETDGAKADLLKSLEYDNSNQDAAKLLVELEEERFSGREGEYNETAREFYEKGLVAYRKGDVAAAGTEWRKALKVAPANPQIKKFLLRVEPENAALKEPALSKKEKTKQKVQAESAKQEKRELRKESRISTERKKSDEFYYEGLRLYKQGKLDDAVSCWEQSLKIDPDNQKTGKALEKIGKKGE